MKQPRPKLLSEQLTQRTAKQEDSSSSSSNYAQFVLAMMTVVYHTGPTRKVVAVKLMNNYSNNKLTARPLWFQRRGQDQVRCRKGSDRKVLKRNRSDDGISWSGSTTNRLGLILSTNLCQTTYMGRERQWPDQVNPFPNELEEQQRQEGPTSDLFPRKCNSVSTHNQSNG